MSTTPITHLYRSLCREIRLAVSTLSALHQLRSKLSGSTILDGDIVADLDAVQEPTFKTEFDSREWYKGIGRGVQERRCDTTINHRDERLHEGIKITCGQFQAFISASSILGASLREIEACLGRNEADILLGSAEKVYTTGGHDGAREGTCCSTESGTEHANKVQGPRGSLMISGGWRSNGEAACIETS